MMRFAWVLGAAAALSVAAPAVAADTIALGVTSGFNGGASFVKVQGFSSNGVLESLVLKDGKPGASFEVNSVTGARILGYFDADGRYVLPGPLTLRPDAFYGKVTRARFTSRFGSVSSGFRVESYEVSGDLAVIPEPSTWALMIVGFGAVGAALRRRAKRVLATA
jgi:hypothetical protein